MVRSRASATSPRASPGSRRCSAATRSSPRSSSWRSGRRRRSRRFASSPRARQSSTTTGGTRSPARSSMSGVRPRWSAPGEVPFGPYYGSVDATPLWLILLSETHRWTGDSALVDELWPNALAALEWIDRAASDDPDGFVAYRRRSAGGLFNQGWKDSGDAIRRRDGGQAVPPIRLAEVQGYVFDARRRMAELARLRGEDALAADARAQGRVPPPGVRGTLLAAGPRLLRNGARRRRDACRRDQLQPGPLPVERDLCAGPGPRGCRPPARARAVLRLGDPNLGSGAARFQPDRLPHRVGLAARHRDRRRRTAPPGIRR